MYKQHAEAVNDISNRNCYLFFGTNTSRLPITEDEIDWLVYNQIIEFDSGCDEKDYKTKVYILTETAQERIKSILDKSKILKIEG